MTLRTIYFGFFRLQLRKLKANGYRRTHCAECTRETPIQCLYRCLYCGVWFCRACAESHFGQTIEEYEAARQPEPTT